MYSILFVPVPAQADTTLDRESFIFFFPCLLLDLPIVTLLWHVLHFLVIHFGFFFFFCLFVFLVHFGCPFFSFVDAVVKMIVARHDDKRGGKKRVYDRE